MSTGAGCSDKVKRLIGEDKANETPLIDPVAIGTGFLGGLFKRLLAKAGLGAVESISNTVLKGAIPDAVPANLPQQVAMNAARSGAGQQIMGEMADAPRLIANYGTGQWAKMQLVARGLEGNITVHWFRNLTTGANVEFKLAHIAASYLK